ncbi:hypothetical protein KKA15_02875 [Patescibacteria group bacterium]|nr:hypothetical protein [Patescibacteria group bacterium]
MKEPDYMDRLITDIQKYLAQQNQEGIITEEIKDTGIFLPEVTREKMERFLKIFRAFNLLVEGLVIGSLSLIMLAPVGDFWEKALIFLVILFAGAFATLVLSGTRQRIRLLIKIEANIARIAESKERIADTLEEINRQGG